MDSEPQNRIIISNDTNTTNSERLMSISTWRDEVGALAEEFLKTNVQEINTNCLKIFNSFTRRKEPFVSNGEKKIGWYICGPTVYDVAHLGHARTYITFDIIRRILSGYFGYQVFYVMNITDIDDKIIKRARSNYLCDKFIENHSLLGDRNSVLQQVRQFIDNYKLRRQDEQEPAKLEMINNILKQSMLALEELEKFTSNDQVNHTASFKSILEKLRDVIADEQDLQFAHTISDHEIFKTLSKKYEQEYHEDMRRLDILPPSELTRVSEFIEQIGAYIKKLEANGFAYRSGGSIYFDTAKFDSDPKHTYAKLVREAYGQVRDLDEGEGELSQAHHDTKRSPHDFAVWKKSKVGEPSWQTQDFEGGRPGWHIECSVMASQLLGENFDIHSGGCDLKFPHHDNEIAQAEAYYNTGKNWVNYFLHSGHLTISGCKMSKSLKNFITIEQALQEYTSRQLRLAFLAHGWAETLDYSPCTMLTALVYEKTFREFFWNVSDVLDESKKQPSLTSDDSSKLSEDDLQLKNEFLVAINRLDAALNDNFDTRSALVSLCGIIKEFNKRKDVAISLLKEIVGYVRKILNIFGTKFDEIKFEQYPEGVMKCIETLTDFRAEVRRIAKTGGEQQQLLNLCDKLRDKTMPELGVHLEDKEGDGGSSFAAKLIHTSAVGGGDTEALMKFVETIGAFRAEVVRISKSGDVKQLLSLCDDLRDKSLPNLGVSLSDEEVDGRSYAVRLIDPGTLAREQVLNEQLKRLKQETQRLEKLKLQQEREQKAKIQPSEMFKQQLDKYSRFDDKGLPTHDANGQEVSKSALKKLQRLHAEQEAKYNKYLAEQKAGQ